MRIFRQGIILVFILALFFGSGPNCVCSIWNVIGVGHDCGDCDEGEEEVVLFEEVEHCDKPSVPCNGANEELPDLHFFIPADSQKQFSTLLLGIIPSPATDFEISISETEFKPLLFYDSVPLLPVNHRVVFCRYLI